MTYMPTRDRLALGLFADWNGGTDEQSWQDLTEVEQQEYFDRADGLLAQERAQTRREAVAEFAKQHGIGDLESRPLYDAQQQLADAKSEIERLRVVERELDGQRLELAAAWETTCEAVGVDTDSTLGEWQTAFDERVAHYHASGYKAGKRDALEEAAEAFNAELGSNAANPGPKYVVGWLHNRAAKLGAK